MTGQARDEDEEEEESNPWNGCRYKRKNMTQPGNSKGKKAAVLYDVLTSDSLA